MNMNSNFDETTDLPEVASTSFAEEDPSNILIAQGSHHYLGAPRESKSWYTDRNRDIYNHITGRQEIGYEGPGAQSFDRATKDYRHLSRRFTKHSLSPKEMSRTWDNFGGIDFSLIDLAGKSASEDFDARVQQYNNGEISERKLNRYAKKYERSLNNLRNNYQELYKTHHSKNGIPLVRTQGSVSTLPFVLGTVGLPFLIAGGGAALPYMGAFLSNPLVQGYFAYNSAKHILSKEGLAKTYNHFKNGEINDGLWSLAGDLWDASTVAPVVSKIYNAGKSVYNATSDAIKTYKAANAFDNSVAATNLGTNYTKPLTTLHTSAPTNPHLQRQPGDVGYEFLHAQVNPRPSTLSADELAGLPKSARNANVKPTLGQNAVDPKTLPLTQSEKINSAVFARNIDDKLETLARHGHSPEDLKNLYSAVRSEARTDLAIPENARAMKEYIKTLPDEVGENFINVESKVTGPVESYFVSEFRNFLNRNGVNPDHFTTHELQKLLTAYSKELNASVTGKGKGIALWHSSSKQFDRFDLRHLGENTNNAGAIGPGNYFSRNPQAYGSMSQTFFVTGLKSIMPSNVARSKGMIPQTAYLDDVLVHPKGNTAVIGPNTGPNDIYKEFYNAPNYEVSIFKNKGIKSLFPHPERFGFNPDGSAYFTPTNWDDVRFNFKTGGNLIKKKLRTKKYFK